MDGFDVNNVYHVNQLNNFKNNYGVSRFIVDLYNRTQLVNYYGWNYNQLIIKVSEPNEYNDVMMGKYKTEGVAGLYVHNPFELDYKCNIDTGISIVGDSIANRADTLPVYMGSYNIYDNCNNSNVYLHPAYDSVINNNPNVYIANTACAMYFNNQNHINITSEWDIYRNYWTNRNTANFIHFHENWPGANNSHTKWDALLDYAKTNSINTIVLYGDAALMTDANAPFKMSDFRASALYNGFIKELKRYIIVYERCDDPCWLCQNDPDSWYVYEVVYTDWN